MFERGLVSYRAIERPNSFDCGTKSRGWGEPVGWRSNAEAGQKLRTGLVLPERSQPTTSSQGASRPLASDLHHYPALRLKISRQLFALMLEDAVCRKPRNFVPLSAAGKALMNAAFDWKPASSNS